jgi:hypothetical protein
VHAAAAEPGRLADRVQPFDRLAITVESPPTEIGPDTTEGFPGKDLQPDRDQRAGGGVEQAVRRDRAAEPVTEVAPRVADALDLRVLAERVAGLPVAGLNLSADRGRVERRGPPGQRVHPGYQVLEGGCYEEVIAVLNECLYWGRGALRQPFSQNGAPVTAGDVWILLGAGERELLLDDPLVEDEPGVVVAGDVGGRPKVLQRGNRVVAGQAGVGQAAAERVEPQ